jgi:hypothetical protein
MHTYDFSPLFRSTIGFDRLFDLAETAQKARYPCILGFRCNSDRLLSRASSAGRPQGAGHHRRNLGSPVRVGRRARKSAGECGSFSGRLAIRTTDLPADNSLCSFFRNGPHSTGTGSVSKKSISKGDTKHDDARNQLSYFPPASECVTVNALP